MRERERERKGGQWGDWSVSNLNKPFSRLKLAASFHFAHKEKREKKGKEGGQKENRDR